MWLTAIMHLFGQISLIGNLEKIIVVRNVMSKAPVDSLPPWLKWNLQQPLGITLEYYFEIEIRG